MTVTLLNYLISKLSFIWYWIYWFLIFWIGDVQHSNPLFYYFRATIIRGVVYEKKRFYNFDVHFLLMALTLLPFDESYCFLLSNEVFGYFVASPRNVQFLPRLPNANNLVRKTITLLQYYWKPARKTDWTWFIQV